MNKMIRKERLYICLLLTVVRPVYKDNTSTVLHTVDLHVGKACMCL